jgi:hypothetical protein
MKWKIMKQILEPTSLIAALLMFCLATVLTGCNLNAPSHTQDGKTNIEYNCPLCKETTLLWCGDCGADLIWCETMGAVNSISCNDCGFISYPMSNSCLHCYETMRHQSKFWTNRSGSNNCGYGF